MLNKERPEVINAMVDYMTVNNYIDTNFKKATGFKGDIEDLRKLREWFNSEYVESYKITRLEYEILKYFEKYPAIGRSGEDSVYIDQWEEVETLNETFSSHLFQFVKEGESIMISDILNNCEVIDDVE